MDPQKFGIDRYIDGISTDNNNIVSPLDISQYILDKYGSNVASSFNCRHGMTLYLIWV